MDTNQLIVRPYNVSTNNSNSPINDAYTIEIKEVKSNEFLVFLLVLLAMVLFKINPETDLNTYTQSRSNEILSLDFNKASIVSPVLDNYTTTFDHQNKISNFLEYKQLLTSKYLIENGVSSTCFLKENQLNELHKSIAKKYSNLLINKKSSEITQAQISFLKEEQLGNASFIKIALDMQDKYHIPASVLLAQAMIQTDWGNRMYANNIYNYIENDEIKEYKNYTLAFEDYAKSLSTNSKYASLFTGGKDFKSWTEKLGQIQCDDSLFSLEKDCYNQMEELIKTLHLDLLDY
ncbi:glucosaminidase domain-containing protein [Chondrinema litorale]|uniref:glucosaminidase domain-containing protein n=1 Tax=Chondrinema litorale TaxID=2994555 RepID=UPI0025438045|nr:glucosaminidase domain-containing protein [Chondrinema litorale]UZR93960.1 glucosaminidase domain-containing protein [Chondrinema litorale]